MSECVLFILQKKKTDLVKETQCQLLGFYLCCAYTVTTHWLNYFRLLQYCDWRKMYHLTQEQVGDMEDHAERELGGKQC